MSWEMFHGHAINRIQDIQLLDSWWGENSFNEVQKLHHQHKFYNNYFSLKFSKWFVIFFVALYMHASVENQFFSSAISEVDWRCPMSD